MTTPDSAQHPRTVREERKLTPMRRTIADRLSKSYHSAVHVTVRREVQADVLVETVDSHETASLVDGILAALSSTLTDHPAFNATFEDDVHRLYEEQNIAIAVDVPDGLVTPVLPAIQDLTLAEIAGIRRQVTEKVQNGAYTMHDLQGSTFTVTNLGPFNVDAFAPIINPPEIAILGVNRVHYTPVLDDGSLTEHPVLPLDLTFDHRVVDGADAGRFLGTLASYLSDLEYVDPER